MTKTTNQKVKNILLPIPEDLLEKIEEYRLKKTELTGVNLHRTQALLLLLREGLSVMDQQ